MKEKQEDIVTVGLPEKVVWVEVKERNAATNEVKTLLSYVLYQVPASG